MGFVTVAVFSVLLAVVPLFFFSLVRRQVFDGLLAPIFGSAFLDTNRVVLGGVLSVIVVNLVVFLFVFVAFVLEKPPPKRRQKRAGDGTPTFGKGKDAKEAREEKKKDK